MVNLIIKYIRNHGLYICRNNFSNHINLTKIPSVIASEKTKYLEVYFTRSVPNQYTWKSKAFRKDKKVYSEKWKSSLLLIRCVHIIKR